MTLSEMQATAGLHERLAARLAELSATELRTASFIVEHPEDVAFLSVNDLARLLETSDATVVRTAQALGYAGFPQLRRELIEAFRNRATPALRLGRGLQDVADKPETLFDQALSMQIQLLQQARQTVPAQDFERAVDLLERSDRILTYGLEVAGHLAQMFAVRLQRIGHEAASISASGLGLADTLLTVRAGDVLVVIADEHAPVETTIVLAEARARDASVILLTEALSSRFAEYTTLALITPRGQPGGYKSLATATVLLDCLLLGLAARNRAGSLLSLERFESLRAQLRRRRVSGSRSPADSG
jgi:DNA-binding MurR/RpiR family transcriptional regulator